MGCAVNQCFSTSPVAVVATTAVTITEDWGVRTCVTTASEVDIPTAPTQAVTANTDVDQPVVKYFPSGVSKVSVATNSTSGDDNQTGLSTGALGGMIAGALTLLILSIVLALLIIRHLNRVAASVGASRRSNLSRRRPLTRKLLSTDSEIDSLSADPLLMSSGKSCPKQTTATIPDHHSDYASPDLSILSDTTPLTILAGGYRKISPGSSSQEAQSATTPPNTGYFEPLPHRSSLQSGITETTTGAAAAKRESAGSQGTSYSYVRHWNNTSSEPASKSAVTLASATSELEARIYVPELAESNTAMMTRDERRRASSNAGNVPELVKREAQRRKGAVA